ncbi:hypothetical protein [Zavarzinella formosa]|uniref:hypothetical protein n=1 Tax=Zavarzinella formosa TaxID=360055 RepID=UPI0002EA36B2|nr:hypothetical protein [Zavarzinella formosa]
MTTALLMLAMLVCVDRPVDAYDVLLSVGDKPSLRLRLKIELDGQSLAKLNLDAKRASETLKGKPGALALDRLMSEGSLLRAEALPAELPHPVALSNAIFKTLDANNDGKLSPDELANADKALLGKFDLDDDESITPLELVPDLQSVALPKRQSVAEVRVVVVPVEGRADLEQIVKLGRGTTYWRGKVGDIPLEIHIRPSLPSEKPEMPRALLAADRAEVKAAFEKTASGVVSLIAIPGPASLFDLIDTDRDGQLGIAELLASKSLLANWKPSDTGVSLVIVRGVAKSPAIPLFRTFSRKSGPEWFRAMDKNGDGDVSPREFLGDPEQFRKIDTDGNGLISSEEAEKVTPSVKEKKP